MRYFINDVQASRPKTYSKFNIFRVGNGESHGFFLFFKRYYSTCANRHLTFGFFAYAHLRDEKFESCSSAHHASVFVWPCSYKINRRVYKNFTNHQSNQLLKLPFINIIYHQNLSVYVVNVCAWGSTAREERHLSLPWLNTVSIEPPRHLFKFIMGYRLSRLHYALPRVMYSYHSREGWTKKWELRERRKT